VAGRETNRLVKQTLESPSAPIVHTVLERPTVTIELTSFATNRPQEERVDKLHAGFDPGAIQVCISATWPAIIGSSRGKSR
jgi:hypothetical protein